MRVPARPLRGAARIARRELRAYLSVPWTYGVAVAFLAMTGVVFYVVADGAREASLRFWFPNLAFVLTVTAPVVTSRLVAEEWRSRHLDILLVRPLSAAGLVVGKWLAAVGFLVLLLVPTLVYVAFLAAFGNPDWPPLVASYAGAVLLVALFGAVGTMTSSLTPTAVAAGLGSFALLVMAQLAGSVDSLRGLSFQPHFEAFARGAPGVEDAVYFTSATVAALVLAAAWQAYRRRAAGGVGRARPLVLPGLVLAGVAGLNLLPVPVTARVDLTATDRFTLSPASADVARNVTVRARITAFAPDGSPEARDAEVLLANYRRANRLVSTSVVDFDKARGLASQLGVGDVGEAAVQVGERVEVVAPVLEQLITSALQRLARSAPQTFCAVAGHGEAEFDSPAPDGFGEALAVLDRNGIGASRLDLTVAEAVPPECTILGLVGARAELLDSEVTLISGFLAADGRLLVMRDPGGPDLDPIVARYGLRFLDGIVVDPQRSQAGDPTALVVDDFPSGHPASDDIDAAQLVGAGGLTTVASDDRGLTVTPVLQSSGPSWLETSREGVAAFDPNTGDRGGPVVLGGAADQSEVRAGGEDRVESGGPSIGRTRILAYADVDWATNAFIGELANADLFANSVNWLAGEEDLVAVGGEDPDLRRLTITSSERDLLGVVVIGGVPAVVALAGVAQWLRRRRR